jgi:dihydrofolate reductase
MCVESLDEAAELCNDPVANKGKDHLENFIIGGAALYDYAIEQDVVGKIYRTMVHGIFPEADTIVQHIDYNEIGFQPKHVAHFPSDLENQYAMTFETWERN